MKKWLIMMLLLIFLAGCSGIEWHEVNNFLDASEYTTMVMNAGEKFDLNLSRLEAKYEFDEVKFQYNDKVVRVNNREELLALNMGKSTFYATLYNNKDMVTTVLLYYIIVIDLTSPMMRPINSNGDLINLIVQNPSGCYYLNRDLDFTYFTAMEPIPYFEGILINPDKHVIKNLTITSTRDCGLFKTIEGAYIDGLIIDNINITGDLNSLSCTAGLAGEVYNSYISNIHITGEIKNGNHAGGIVGVLNNSALVNSSFKGKVTGKQYVGGLAGETYSNIVKGASDIATIENCYALCDISSELERNTSASIGGLVGTTRDTFITGSYYCGEIIGKEKDYVLPLIGSYSGKYRLTHVYYVGNLTLDGVYVYDGIQCLEAIVEQLSIEELKSGEGLPGLEAFTFITGEFPFLS